MVSPLTMEFMIAFRCSGVPKGKMGPSWDSSAGKDVRQWLLINGLIDREDEFGKATDKGTAWLERALSTPLPEAQWVFPDAPTPPTTGDAG